MNRLGTHTLVALMMACTVTASAHATPLKGPREAEVQAPLSAKTTTLTASVSPNNTHVPSVGVMGTASDDVGQDQWLTTLWQAAFVATQATDTSLLDFEFMLGVAGPLDGPSAGLLAASTLTALITGKKVLPHTSMTGAVNPDASVGPVDDVLARLRAAAAGGVKRFGFPLGARQQVDASGAVTDLLVEGQKLGVEVKELTGLDDAYLFLTGSVLPRAPSATDADMELWPAELAAVARLTRQVRSEVEAERPQLDASSPWSARIDRAMKQAADFEQGGDAVRAMVVWTSLLTTLRVAAQDERLTRALDARDAGAVFAVVKPHEDALPKERSALRRDIDERFPNVTRANDIYAMDLLESVVTQGNVLQAEGDAKALRSVDAGTPAFSQLAHQYAEGLLRSREELNNGQRFLSLYASLPPLKKNLPPISAARLASWYASAGDASRAYFKARLTPALEKDSTYLDLLAYAELLKTENDGRARLVLAARQTIYSAYLVNTYYSLGAQLDAKGVFTIRNARALAPQLDHARTRALQSCGRAKRETGSIPFPARMRFLNARAAREGSDLQKAETLADLWIANWWCEFAVRDAK